MVIEEEPLITREDVEEALKVIDHIEKAEEEDPDYDVLPDAKRLNKLIPGKVYGKSTYHIRCICNELLEEMAAATA